MISFKTRKQLIAIAYQNLTQKPLSKEDFNQLLYYVNYDKSLSNTKKTFFSGFDRWFKQESKDFFLFLKRHRVSLRSFSKTQV